MADVVFVTRMADIGRDQIALVGGKAANLAELARIDGIRVPDGFCVTTAAFRRFLAQVPDVDAMRDELAGLDAGNHAEVSRATARLRAAIEAVAIPTDVADEITSTLVALGENTPCAVRSSATAEDLPGASFAGQQDSYLDVVGEVAVLEHVRRCWASLFTDRAVSYRLRNGFDHRRVQMAVVVQQMVAADAAGVLFTADPVTSHRGVAVVEAVAGIGEAFVSGQAEPDSFSVHGRTITARSSVHDRPVLTDAQVLRLAEFGRRIEAHFGAPQDIEWCLAGDDFQFVQSRPVTTLFPVPDRDDTDVHVYVSVGHQQMMTDPLTPLGLSFWQLTTPRPMAEAGGRLFVDVAPALAAPQHRERMLMLGRSDPLIGDALQTLVERPGFLPPAPEGEPTGAVPPPPPEPIATDPAVVTDLIETNRASVAALRDAIRGRTGPALIDFIRSDLQELRRLLFAPRSTQVVMTGMQAAWWLNEHLQEWLGETNAADTLAQYVAHNVTAEMGLDLLDLADVVRPHSEVVAFLERVGDAPDDLFLDELDTLPGGAAVHAAVRDYLTRYGMRCAGEIDLTRPRWGDRPVALLPALLSNVRAVAPGEALRRVTQGRQAARAKEGELLARLRLLPDGARRAAETKEMIDRVRTFGGYREYPKYGMVSRYHVYRRALLDEADRLVGRGVLRDREDVYFLRFDELADVVRTGRADEDLIDRRRRDFVEFGRLTPPRVFTSDGEVVRGRYRREDVPEGALPGLAVSAGVVEGRARVVHDMAHADVEAGDILVTAFTDPSWTPLFVTVSGLVTEAGGLMTHGTVIAREYGLPAVVGVERATELVRDGDRIRVHGTAGYVEVLA